MNRRTGFTLIELLVVVGIIGILSAIAIPNMLEAQVRAKVSRAKNDLRTLATALEAYHVEHHAYPEIIPSAADIMVDGGAWLMKPLTTPVAYISSLPPDPFLPRDPEWFMPDLDQPNHRVTYRYSSSPFVEPATTWGVSSNGPNLVCDTLGIYHGLTPGLFYGQDPLNADWALYDPTNGTISRGDIYRARDFVMP